MWKATCKEEFSLQNKVVNQKGNLLNAVNNLATGPNYNSKGWQEE